MTYKIDASNKVLGRLATEIAMLLRGKNSPEFTSHVDSQNSVEVSNVNSIRVTGNKATQKTYFHYTGYPGGIRETNYQKLKERKPGEALRRAVYGMLPNNRLRSRMMKRLTIS
mgnify:CR=1 FL=1